MLLIYGALSGLLTKEVRQCNVSPRRYTPATVQHYHPCDKHHHPRDRITHTLGGIDGTILSTKSGAHAAKNTGVSGIGYD